MGWPRTKPPSPRLWTAEERPTPPALCRNTAAAVDSALWVRGRGRRHVLQLPHVCVVGGENLQQEQAYRGNNERGRQPLEQLLLCAGPLDSKPEAQA